MPVKSEFNEEILTIIKEYNVGNPIGFPILDRKMLKRGLFGSELKILVDTYVAEGFLIWVNSLSLQVTQKGIDYLNEEIGKE